MSSLPEDRCTSCIIVIFLIVLSKVPDKESRFMSNKKFMLNRNYKK